MINNNESLIDWPSMFMGVALLASARSKDAKKRNGACVISADQKIVGVGYNGLPRGCSDDDPEYWSDNDDDAYLSRHSYIVHAEVNAIREACRKAGNPHIVDAVLYSSCEPCPMCYSTAYWARVGKIFYAASWTDYADLFDDSNIAKDMSFPYERRHVALQQIMQPDAQKVWEEFRRLPDRARY